MKTHPTTHRTQYRLLVFSIVAGLATVWWTGSVCAQSASVEYALAAGYYSRGQWSESGEAFADLIKDYPGTNESASAQFFLAETLMQKQKFESASNQFQQFLDWFPDHEHATRALFRIGESAYRTQRYEVAIRNLEDFVSQVPTHELNEFALPYLGEMRLRREEPQLAQRAFETALKMYPNGRLSNQCRLGLAKALQRLGSEFEATRFYRYLMDQTDSDLAGQAQLQLGIMSFGKNNFGIAEEYFSESMNHCTSTSAVSEATFWLARARIEIGDSEGAVEILKSIVSQDLDERLATAILYDGAVSASKIGDQALALVWLEQLRERFPANTLVAEAMKFEIELHQAIGDTDQALALLKQYRQHPDAQPINTSLFESEGRGLYAAKRYQDAAIIFGLLLESLSNESLSNESLSNVPDSNTTDASESDVANWRYLKGICHLGLREFQQAEQELDQLREQPLSPGLQPLVHIANATTKLGLEKYDEAIPAYQSYLQMSPEGDAAEQAQSRLILCLAEVGRWDEAAILFDDFAEQYKNSPLRLESARYLATRAERNHELAFARKWYEVLAQSSNPIQIVEQGLSGLAWLHVESSNTNAVFEIYHRMLMEFPSNKQAGQSALARASFLVSQSDTEDAIRIYEMIRKQLHQTRWANIALLQQAILLQRAGDPTSIQSAKLLLLEYLELPQPQPQSDKALYRLSWLNRDLGLTDESQRQFQAIVTDHPNSPYWPDSAYRIISQAFADREFEKATTLIEKLLNHSETPTSIVSRSLFLQGQIAASDDRWSDVADSMRRLISECQDNRLKTKSEYWLAESLYRQGKFGDAVEKFVDLIPTIAEVDESLEPWIHLRTAQCYGKRGDWPQAAQYATDAQTRFPQFHSRFEFDFLIGRALEDDGKLGDARIAFERIVNSKPGGSTETAAIAQWRIGETFFHQQDYKNAIKAYYKVDSLFSYPQWRSAALMQAGKCQEHLHRNQHAIELYTQLIDRFPKTEYASDARARREQLLKNPPVISRRTNQPIHPTTTSNRR